MRKLNINKLIKEKGVVKKSSLKLVDDIVPFELSKEVLEGKAKFIIEHKA